MLCKITSYNLLFLLTLMLYTFSIDHVLTLNVEEIIGGYPAFQANYKHHAAIVGKYNHSNYRHLVCSGAIIGDFFVLSASRCFFSKNFLRLKKLTFYVLVGVTEISAYEPDAYEIDEIILAARVHEYPTNDLAVTKLKKSLELQDRPNLVSLKIPYLHEEYPKSALVAGYGTKIYEPLKMMSHSIKLHRITVNPGMNLTYAYVELSGNDECKDEIKYVGKSIYICGVIKPDCRHRRRGLCTGDAGAPLFHDGKIIGMAIKNNKNCDDTGRGNIYVKVSMYKEFIQAVMSDNFEDTIESPIVYPNPLHIYNISLSISKLSKRLAA